MAGRLTILVGRYNRLFQKLLSMKGDAVMDTLAPELMPTLPLFHGRENRYLEGWDLFAFSTFVAGGVGTFPQLQFRNPGGSNVIAVFESVLWAVTLADQPFIELQTTAADFGAAVSLVGTGLDARARRNPTLIGSSRNFGHLGLTTRRQAAMAANSSFENVLEENQEIPLLPGDALVVEGAVANQGLTTSVLWRERFLEDSERA